MKREIHIQLRTVFVQLYSTPAELLRVAREAGVPVERVVLGNNMLNDWGSVLDEAAKQQGIAALLDVAQQEYGGNNELIAASVAFAEFNRTTLVVTLPASDTLLLNFTRAFTLHQQQALEIALGKRLGKLINLPVRFDDARPYGPQCVALAEQVGLTPTAWETLPIVVNPPGFVPGALCLLSELHGRMGYFPAVVRLRPVANSNPPQFELAEVMNLQALRRSAHERNGHASS
ncbi:MAG: hypothetical protein KF832_29075 [Caldilineaceae bacterium]|nr:hypothetical protein [Caldilineaceae bacterium]